MYARRLRAHGAQELLAAVGIAVAVALVLSATLAEQSISSSARQVVHTIVGPAQLQLRARSDQGFPESTLARVQKLPGVARAAPLLDQNATVAAPSGRSARVQLAGADLRLATLDGLAETLPIGTLSSERIALTRAAAGALDLALPAAGAAARPTAGSTAGAAADSTVPAAGADGPGSGVLGAAAPGSGAPPAAVTLDLRGRAYRLPVSAVLGPGDAGALSAAPVAVMPLSLAQRLAGLPGRVTRILVQAQPGRVALVRSELDALANNTANTPLNTSPYIPLSHTTTASNSNTLPSSLEVAPADQDLALLRQALGPSDLASGLFAAIGGLLGFLLAFNAMLLTVADRRRAIADLRIEGATRATVVEMVAFEALCLGLVGSLAGVAGGWALASGAFHHSTAYLAQAFVLSPSTLLDARAVALALAGGLLATLLASAVPLLDLRPGQARDAVYRADGSPGNTLTAREHARLAGLALALVAAATALWTLQPGAAIPATALLALGTVMAVPLAFALVLSGAARASERLQRLAILPLALASLRATTVRSLALAATGAVALFGSIALGGARENLLQGIERFSRGYVADADVWVGNPGDNQAVDPFRASPAAPASALPPSPSPASASRASASPPSAARPRGTALSASHARGAPASASPASSTSPAAGGYARRIARVAGVSRVRAFYGGFLQLGGRRVWVIARPPGGADRVLATQLRGGSLALALARLSRGGWVAVSEAIAGERHLRIGDPLLLPTPTGPLALRVAATTTNLAWPPGVVFMSAADFTRAWPGAGPTALAIALRPGADPRAAQSQIARALAGSGLQATLAADRARSIDALASSGLGQLREIALLLLAAATLAMGAALTSSIWQRRAGLAGLRLLGARSHSVLGVLGLEALLMLGAGCLTGALAGVYGQVVIDAFLRHVTGFPIADPTTSIHPVAIFAGVLAAALALGAIPGLLAARVRPALALAAE
jgi:putative ABC transport system permease protein